MQGFSSQSITFTISHKELGKVACKMHATRRRNVLSGLLLFDPKMTIQWWNYDVTEWLIFYVDKRAQCSGRRAQVDPKFLIIFFCLEPVSRHIS